MLVDGNKEKSAKRAIFIKNRVFLSILFILLILVILITPIWISVAMGIWGYKYVSRIRFSENSIFIFILLVLFVLVILGAPIWLFVAMGILGHEHIYVEWYGKDYYLQQKKTGMIEGGYHLFIKIDGEKKLIFPHVYNYKIEKGIVYLVSDQGYCLINLRNGESNIILLKGQLEKVDSKRIQYSGKINSLTEEQLEKLNGLERRFLSYDKRGGALYVGNGRYQLNYYSGESGYPLLYVYGLYENFDYQNLLFTDITGYFIPMDTEKMYVTSPEGYAIVDGLSSTCRVYFTNSDLAGKDYHEDIQVLDSYEDFTSEEQGILERVEKEGLP